METMEQEVKFLNMLGYKREVVPNSNNTIWNVLDENNNVVGKIQRKKLRRKNKAKGLPAEFGYITEIDSDIISHRNTRWISDKYDNFSYTFDIKRGGEDTDHVEMSCGEFPGITVWSKEHGYMQFSIGHDTLFANFKSRTENFNLEEIVVFKYLKHDRDSEYDYGREYTYQLRHASKDIELTDDRQRRTSREISIEYNPNYQEKGQVEVKEKTWFYSNLVKDRKSIVAGTVEEAIEKHQMGIDAISHFRHILNSILPFKQEIMETMLARTPYIVEPGMKFFFPDIVEQLEENPCLDCRTQGSCDMLGITEQNLLNLKKA